jgi:hypothetical protein
MGGGTDCARVFTTQSKCDQYVVGNLYGLSSLDSGLLRIQRWLQRMRNVIDRRFSTYGNRLNFWRWRYENGVSFHIGAFFHQWKRVCVEQCRMHLLFSYFCFCTLGGYKTTSPFAVRCGGKNNNRRRASIPGGSGHTAGIHLQSSVQRVAGQKVRGRRGMLLDVRRMRSLSGIHSKLRV